MWINQKLLNAQSAEGSIAATPRGFRGHGALETTHLISWGDGVGSGEVSIEHAAKETAPDAEWALLEAVAYTGNETDTRRVPGAHGAFRHRITQIVVSGTVTTRIMAT